MDLLRLDELGELYYNLQFVILAKHAIKEKNESKFINVLEEQCCTRSYKQHKMDTKKEGSDRWLLNINWIAFDSWASGANAWGPEKDEKFTKPNHWDGMLEVVGVTGVVHMGQIQSGLRSAIRIIQVWRSCHLYFIYSF